MSIRVYAIPFVLAASIILSACCECKYPRPTGSGEPVPVEESPSASPSPTDPKTMPTGRYKGWAQAYNAFIADLVTTNMLKADVKDICKAGASKEMWVELVKWISYFESSFDSGSTYQEKTLGVDVVTGKPVVSEGLMQLSYSDQRYYKNCKLSYEAKNIQDPAINLHCAMVIIDKLLENSSRPVTHELGRYWSTIRAQHKQQRIIERVKRNVPGC